MKREDFILTALLHRISKVYADAFSLYGYTPAHEGFYQNLIQKAEEWASGGVLPSNELPQKSLYATLEKLNQAENYTPIYAFDAIKMTLSDSFFPKKNPTSRDFKSLIQQFCKEANTLPRENKIAFLENCYNLLYKYTVSISCGVPNLSDVSLFDHSRMTAAFAISLYDYLKENPKNTLEPTDKPVLFLGGNISGIQNYIYNIISKFATKNLKGRSFYLQLLTDSVIQKLRHELQLFETNIVYASGGGFYMIVPNTEFAKNKIHEIEKCIADAAFQEFKTVLSLNIAYTELAYTDITGETNTLNQKWAELIEKLNNKKRLKYADKFSSEYHYFFEEAEQGGQLKKDVITNEEITDTHFECGQVYEFTEEEILDYPAKKANSYSKYVLQHTKAQIELGEQLRKTKFLIRSAEPIEWNTKVPHYQNPLNLGIHWYFFEELPRVPAQVTCTLIQFNSPEDFLKTEWNSPNIVYSFAFYGGNKAPVHSQNKYQIKNFNDLAGTEQDKFKRLAILRMDVDNLGNAFINGLGKYRTFSRYSTISRSLDFFFKGYLNKIWQDNVEFKEWTYIVYSGGDDLFIVGKWDKVIEFAETIHTEFKKWTGNNNTLTLSAGIAIVPAKYPVLKAADLAGEAEEHSKNHTNGTQSKNAICILDVPLNWETEFPTVKVLKNELVQRLSSQELPKGFLHKIQTLYEMSITQKKNKQNESWKWILAYDFKRATERKKNTYLQQFLEDLKKNILTNTHNGKKLTTKYTFLELLNLASRWAELELKNQSNPQKTNKSYEYEEKL